MASLLTLFSYDVYEAASDETLNDNAPQIVIAGGFIMDIQGDSVPVLVHWSSGPLKEEWKIEHLVKKMGEVMS